MKLIYKNWVVHNVIAHPVMQLLRMIKLQSLGDKIHDATLPNH